MKPQIILLLVAIAISQVFHACKKGENDPFLSLKSRKARLTGQWKPTNINITRTKGDSTWNWSLRGSTMYVKLNGSDFGSYSYDETLNIEKDGTFNRYLNEQGYRYTGDGIWYFAGKNKEEGMKDKEVVVFAFHTEKFDPGETYTFKGIQVDLPYRIDQLKNKEMILMIDYNYYHCDGDVVNRTETRSYEKNK